MESLNQSGAPAAPIRPDEQNPEARAQAKDVGDIAWELNNKGPPLGWDWSGKGTHVDFTTKETLPLKEVRSIGYGRNGIVFETECKGVTLAWKRRLCRYKIGPEERKEIEILKKLDHQHIVKLVGTYTHLNFLGILLWPVAVCDLATYFEDLELLHHPEREDECRNNRHAIDERFSALGHTQYGWGYPFWQIEFLPRLAELLGCLASAVEHLHSQGVRHKDLKPSNILLTRGSLYLTDFDASTDFSLLSTSNTEGGERGTPKYFAPEVARYQRCGRAADIFSLGCIFLEIVTLAGCGCLDDIRRLRPRGGGAFHENLSSCRAWKDSELDEHDFIDRLRRLITRMLDYQPDKRPTASEVILHLATHDGWYHTEASPYSWVYGQCCAPMMLNVYGKFRRKFEIVFGKDLDLDRHFKAAPPGAKLEHGRIT